MIKKSYEVEKKIFDLLKYNLFLLYGENYGLKKDIREIIKSEIKKNDSNVELSSLYEKDITDNEDNFYNSIYSGSLFGNKKIITIYNGTDKIISQVEDINQKYPENVFIIIFSEILEKKSKLRNFFETNTKTICIPCYLDNERDLEIIANKELKKENVFLSKESMNLLIEKSNSDRDNLKNELEKIKSFSLNKKKIEIDEVKSIINFSGEYKSDLFINECLSGNTLQYKKIFSEMYINTVNQTYLLRILSNKIQRLLSIKKKQSSSNNLENLVNDTRPPIFWKEKPVVKKQLSIWKLDDLQSIIKEINDIEILCKKNPQISKIVFFDFFSKICQRASSYS